MSYKSYVMFLSQIASQPKAVIEFQDLSISIQKGDQKDRWVLSTSVFKGEEGLSPTVQECVSTSGTLRWQTNGAYLKIGKDKTTVSLVQELSGALTFQSFTQILTDFSSLAAEWREIFEDNDYSFIV